MKEINNLFISSIEYGDFIIENGILSVKNDYLIGQYIYIPGHTNRTTRNPRGSILNEGIYLVHDDLITLKCNVQDEKWNGAVCGLAIPKDFINLTNEINEYVKLIESDPKQAILISERVGNYSRTMATDQNGLIPTWQTVYANKLQPYRRMFKTRIF